jgi:hypothetical protein
MAKKCNTCHIEQDLSKFYKDSSLPGGYKHRCKLCTRSYTTELYKKTGAKRRAQTAAWKLKNPSYVKNHSLEAKYGISLDTYNIKLAQQDYRCAICYKHENDNAGGRKLAVDHNHSTGQVRGLLCYHCNLAVGMLSDNKFNALRVAEYLESYEKESTL